MMKKCCAVREKFDLNFQAELLTKLNKRRSQYSDEDDGLPHSPTPPVTTADIIMGGPLKVLAADFHISTCCPVTADTVSLLVCSACVISRVQYFSFMLKKIFCPLQ